MLQIYLIIGAFAGFASGLLGIGGGTVIVPALAAVFVQSTVIPKAYAMQFAIGTSLSTMVFTALSGFYAHYKKSSVRWDTLKQVIPGLLIGVLIGALIAYFLPSLFLKQIFGVFLLFFAFNMLLPSFGKITTNVLSKKAVGGFSILIGSLSSILGAGGGVMLVPFLLRLQLTMHEAIGTSLACVVLMSLVATLCFLLPQVSSAIPQAMSTGYIYWPAFAGIAIASVLFAPMGSFLAHHFSPPWLKRLFAVFLFVMALDMLIFAR